MKFIHVNNGSKSYIKFIMGRDEKNKLRIYYYGDGTLSLEVNSIDGDSFCSLGLESSSRQKKREIIGKMIKVVEELELMKGSGSE